MRVMLVLFLVLGCTKPMTQATTNTQASANPQTAPVAVGPRVILPSGFVVSVEIADDADTRARGLMYRDQLPSGTGMLFFFPQPGDYPFWMKNTRIALDIIWIDAEKRIVHIAHEVPPCQIEDCPSYPPNAIASYVLELAGGESKKLGLKVGDVLQFERTENIAAR